MDLIDALAANQGCSSVVALSEAPQSDEGMTVKGRATDNARGRGNGPQLEVEVQGTGG